MLYDHFKNTNEFLPLTNKYDKWSSRYSNSTIRKYRVFDVGYVHIYVVEVNNKYFIYLKHKFYV